MISTVRLIDNGSGDNRIRIVANALQIFVVSTFFPGMASPTSNQTAVAADASRPNIVLIMADDKSQ